MKKFAIYGLVLVLAACADSSTGGLWSGLTSAPSSDASIRQKMQSCMFTEAQSKLQAGTLFSKGISDTADELVSICTKKLALQSVGISEESQSAAVNIINNLKTMAQ